MARPREFDNDKVLTALRDVFWEHGYNGTSYANIMSATGLQKGSLYSAFGDKRSLYHEALRHYDAENVNGTITMLSNESLTGEERVANLMQSLADAAQTKRGRWGCLLCNAAVDQAPFHEPTEKIVVHSMNRMKAGLDKALRQTRAADKVELIWTLYFGARVIIKSGGSKATLMAIKTQVLSLIKTD
ncbi:MAG: TetR/AcrR family transcriptional regulator [Maricaulaceae bacterium]